MSTLHDEDGSSQKQPAPSKKGLGFWLILLSLALSMFVVGLDLAAVATLLPVVIEDLKGSEFVWVGSAYPLAATAFLPLSGGLSEIFGRRPTMLLNLGLFSLGSALCGSAKTTTWLIGARTIQGLGGGGIQSVSSIIISDLVTLKERGTYNAVLGLAWAFSAAIGPVIAGTLASHGQWRWLFYLNLPISGVSIAMVLLFLRLPTPKGSFSAKLGRMDWIGNILVTASTAVVALAVTWGGVDYRWSSAHVLVPLILGLLGFVVFAVYEAKWAREPILPISLLSNVSSVSGYIQTFMSAVGMVCIIYYLAVYYQACKDASPQRSGVYALGLALAIGPTIIISGASVSITKRYRPQIWIAWVCYVIGLGVSSTLSPSSSIAKAVGIPILPGLAIGILSPTTYFPVLAPLHVSQNAYALAFFAFCRSFAGIWGVAVGGAILQNELGKRLASSIRDGTVPDVTNVDLLYATIPRIRDMEEPLKSQLQNAFSDSLAVVWEVMCGIVGIGLLASLLMPNLPLQNQLDEKWSVANTTNNNIDMNESTQSPRT